MKRIAIMTILAFVWAALVSGPALAAGTVMIETRAFTAHGQELGVIKRIALSEGGCIKYVILSIHGRLIPIPWRVVTVSPERHAVVLGINRTILEKAPVIKSGEWTQINEPRWEHQIDQFYQSYISRGKEELQGRAGRVEKPEGTLPQGSKLHREPAAPGRSLKGPATTEQAQPPSNLSQEEKAKPGHPPKESMKRGRDKRVPPSNAPGAVQPQHQGEEAGPGAMMKEE